MCKNRLNRLLSILRKEGKFPYFIQNLTNIKYLTGFQGSYANLIIDEQSIFFITDSRYQEYASLILPDSIELVVQKTDIFTAVKNVLKIIKKKNLFVENLTPLVNFISFKQGLKGIKIIPNGDEVSGIRAVKDNGEIAYLTEAVSIADRCFSHLLTIIKPGIIEWDIAVEIEYFYRKNGCRRSSFDSVVASGPGSSMPHYVTSMSKKILHGDILLVDMGCEYNGYNSDLTRTVFVGSIQPEFRKIYHTVRKAQEAAISLIKPGIAAGKLDKTARDIISGEGYGKLFGHALGHGVGLEVHEPPALKTGSKFRLKNNMTVTIEPGIYIPDRGGVRIEDLAVVTENGYKVLTESSKDIIVL